MAVLTGFLLGALVAAGSPAATSPMAGLEVRPEPAGVVLEYTLPRFELRAGQGDTSGSSLALFPRYQIEAPALARSADPGLPALPGQGIFVALPPGARARLRVEEASFHEVRGVWIDPPPTSRVMPEDGGDGDTPRSDMLPSDTPKFAAIPDPEVYSTDAFLPGTAVALGEQGVARDVDFVRIELSPFSWNPVRGVLRVYDRIRFRVEYERTPKATGGTAATFGAAEAVSGARRRGVHAEQGSSGPGPVAGPADHGGGFFANPVPAEWHYRHQPERAAEIHAAVNPAASIEAYKIEVAADGIYRVSHAALVAEGFPSLPAPFADLRLELRGQRIALGAVDADRDGNFGPGDSLEFFGVANPERWTKTHIYWLTRIGGGMSVRPVPAMPDGSGSYRAVRSALATVRAEKDENLFIFTVTDPDLWDPWLYDYRILTTGSTTECLVPGNTGMDVDFDLRSFAPPDPSRSYQLRGQVVGRKIGICNPDEQQLDLSLNAAPVGSVSWNVSAEGMLKSFARPINPAVLTAGQNRVHLEQPVLVDKLRWSQLDFLELDYEKRLVAENGTLDFRGSWPSGAVFYASGFTTASVTALDVRSDGQVYRLEGVRPLSLGPGQPLTLAFGIAPEGNVTHRIVLAERPRIRTPRVTRDKASSLSSPANQGQYLALTHASFKVAIQDLVDYRNAQGMTTALADVEDVYDEYSWGNVDARAIRDFLIDALAGWADPPLYVVLVGDSTQDFKNNWPAAAPLYLPHLEYLAVGGGATYGELLSTDSRFQTLVGNDAVPDLLVGRLAVQSPSEVSSFVSKLRAYETGATQPWNGSYLVTVDDDTDIPAFPCVTTATAGEQHLVAMSQCHMDSAGDNPGLKMILVRNSLPTTNAQIIAARNQGVSFNFYLGHGSIEAFGTECPTNGHIFGISDMTNLTSDALPLSATISCNVGAFAWEDRTTGRSRCFGESFVNRTDKGDIAFIGSVAGLTEYEGRGQLDGMFDGLFRAGSSYLPPFVSDGRRRAGGIHFAGQMGFLRNGRILSPLLNEWDARTLALHGDPATILRIADPPSPPRATCP